MRKRLNVTSMVGKITFLKQIEYAVLSFFLKILKSLCHLEAMFLTFFKDVKTNKGLY